MLRGDLRGMYGTIEHVDPDGRNVIALLPIPDMRTADETRRKLAGEVDEETMEHIVRHVLDKPRRVRLWWRDIEPR